MQKTLIKIEIRGLLFGKSKKTPPYCPKTKVREHSYFS